MSVEFKLFGGRFEPQKGALKKDSTLPVYATFTRAKNKSIAKTLLHAEFLKFAPDYADDYFAPKVWEAVEGMFCTTEGQFYTDAFTGDIIWNAEKGEPERVLVEPELSDDGEQLNEDIVEEKMTAVKPLPANYRAASLVLFGSVEEITATQYGQVMDLVNDDESSFARELAEAIAREPRVLELLPERQEELLVHLRETLKETAQWTDIKRPIVKWIETPPAKREQANDNDRLNINDLKERSIKLRYLVALGKLSRAMDIDVYSPDIGHEMRINAMLSDKKETEINDWFVPLSRTPGVYDFSPAAIVAMIKTADEKLHIYPGELRKYIDKCVTDFDCVNPPQLVIDIACGRTIAPLPQASSVPSETSDWSESSDDQINADIDRSLAERAEIEKSTSNEVEKKEVVEREDDRLPVSDREIEIAHALNDLMSGHTDIMGKEEAEGVVACTSHLIAHVSPLLIADITTTELCLHPNFSDDEIHDVATTILDSWSDDLAVRQKIALDAIVEYRKPVPPKKQSSPEPEPEPEIITSDLQIPATEPAALTWRRQLIIAAMQGMCANPAYINSHDDIPFMAVALADGVISAEIAP